MAEVVELSPENQDTIKDDKVDVIEVTVIVEHPLGRTIEWSKTEAKIKILPM